MLRIIIDLFSGRPNPSWELTGAAARRVLGDLASNKRALNTGPGPSLLGFRGLIVEVADASAAEEFGLPTTFRLADGRADDVSGSQALAETLLKTAPDLEGLRDYALTEIRNVPFQPIDTEWDQGSPSATGQRDAWPKNASTIPDGTCSVEVGDYNPAFWNSSPYLTKNNCYAYGCNMRTNTFPQPGRYSGHSYAHTLASVLSCAKADGAKLQSVCSPPVEQPRWLVALVTTPDNAHVWDYHWYRKQNEGYWGHKPGETLVTRRDNSGKTIYDPQSCNRGIYTVWGGYLYVPVSMNIN